MLRFRNRFKGEPAQLETCRGCGRRISTSIADGRETIIHEFPLCPAFEETMGIVASKTPDMRFHMAAAELTPDGVATVVLADGDSLDEVTVRP